MTSICRRIKDAIVEVRVTVATVLLRDTRMVHWTLNGLVYVEGRCEIVVVEGKPCNEALWRRSG